MNPAKHRKDHSCTECRDTEALSRRRFLQAVGVTGAAVAASPLLAARAAWAAGSYTGPVLLVLSLRGGMDGLSMVPPIGDPDYARSRPTIAVPAANAIDTGDRMFGLNPGLAPLQPLWNSGRLAAVHAVGTPDQTRSHFSATDELERAAPGSSIRTGWLDRVLGAAGSGTVFEAVALGDGTAPGLLAGPQQALATYSLDSFSLQSLDWVGPRLTRVLRTLHDNPALPNADAATMTLDALDTVSSVITNFGGAHNGAVYPDPQKNPLAAALADAAALIRADIGLQALTIDVDSWDMHSDLGAAGTGQFADKAGAVAAALAAFATDLGPLFDRVTVVTLSEFGRRVQENGSGGVDHGHGNAVLLAGGGLSAAKVFGTWPGLTDAALDDGDLAGTTDYRSVLAEYLVNRMGLTTSQLSAIFPGFTPSFVGAFA